jgi:diketogulonate reductase-like aldo/keto reductase
MRYKELGKTGVLLPELALGTWRYRGGVESLIAGIDLGINFIDTAEAYGNEEIVGRAIKGRRDDVFLATKVLPRHFRRKHVIHAAEQSLRRLNTDCIDLYQLHWPNYAVPIAETMAAMEELVAAGKVRFIGVSNFSVTDLEKAQASLSNSKIVSNQVRYSLVNRTIEDGLLQYCESKQITVLVFSPLATGLMNIRGYDREDVLGRIASAIGRTRVQVALNWCIRWHNVIAIFKADKIEHVRENCGASGWNLSASDLDSLERIPFQRLGHLEKFARRLARHCLQRMGRNI